jgi:hypothetical protein
MHPDAYPTHSWCTVQGCLVGGTCARSRRSRRHRLLADGTSPTVARDRVLQADEVRRLTYTRAQAAEALGVSLQTIDRRVVPAIDTVKTAWGSRLDPYLGSRAVSR